MDLIQLIKYIVIFACVAWGLYALCVRFSMPTPVLWLCGAVLLIILLSSLGHLVGVPNLKFP